jgi:hypothetical protein
VRRKDAAVTNANRRASGVIALCLSACCLILPVSVQAQNQAIDDLKGKIFDANMAKQTFARGLRFCNELDGNHFYFQPRDRVLDLEEYHRSLENLAREHVFNPETRRPWSEADAAARWAHVQKEAVQNKADCQIVATLPALQQQLEELEKKPQTSEKIDKPAEQKN